jgi:hypothetical protein
MTDNNLNRDARQALNWLDCPTQEGYWWYASPGGNPVIPIRVISVKTSDNKLELRTLVREAWESRSSQAPIPVGKWQKILPWIGEPYPNKEPKHN